MSNAYDLHRLIASYPVLYRDNGPYFDRNTTLYSNNLVIKKNRSLLHGILISAHEILIPINKIYL